jgi:hypothetical protein
VLDRVIGKCLTPIPQTVTFQVFRRSIAQSANVPVPLVFDAFEARLQFSARKCYNSDQWSVVGKATPASALFDTEQSAKHPSLPCRFFLVMPSTYPLRITCTASIPAMTAAAVIIVRGPYMSRSRRLTHRWSDSMRLFA